MADNLGSIGAVFVEIQADLASLHKAFDRARPEAAKEGERLGQQLAEGVTRGADGRLRDARGQLVGMGKTAGDGIGEGIKKGIDEQVKKIDFSAFGEKLQKVATIGKTLGATLSATVTAPLVGIAAFSGKVGADFEQAFQGIRKTVEGTEPQFARLREEIRALALEIPVSAAELSKIGEIAGQMGLPVDEIKEFTKVIANMSVATNLSVEGAATAIGQLSVIMGTASKDFERLASTIVHLGNISNATESQIVDMGQRFAATAVQIGLSEAQVLSWAAALADAGVDAEAGGTAISRTFKEIAVQVATGGGNLANFAAIAAQSVSHAGISVQEFRDLFAKDANAAVAAFVEGLGRIRESGGNTIAILEALGVTEIRQSNALLGLSANYQKLNGFLREGEQAWRDNVALSREANEFYRTTTNQLKLLANALADVGIELFEAMGPILKDTVIPTARLFVNILKDLASGFSSLPGPIQKFIFAAGAIVAVLGPVIFLVSSFLGSIATMAIALGGLGGASGVISKVVLAFGSLGQTIKALPIFAAVRNLGDLRAAVSLLGSTSLLAKAGLIGLAAGIGILIGHIINLGLEFFGLQKYVDSFLKTIVGAIPIIGKYVTGQDAIDESVKASGKAHKDLVAELKRRGIAVDEARLKDDAYLAQLTKLVTKQTDGERAAKAQAEATKKTGEAAAGAVDPLKNLTGGLDTAAEAAKKAKEELAQLVSKFNDALRPADALNVDLQKLMATGISSADIIRVYGDQIIEAAKSQRMLGGEVQASLKPLEEQALKIKAINDALDRGLKTEIPLGSSDPNNPFRSTNRPDFSGLVRPIEFPATVVFDPNSQLAQQEVERRIQSTRQELEDSRAAARRLGEEIEMMARAGATTEEIFSKLGPDIERAVESARRTGSTLDPIILNTKISVAREELEETRGIPKDLAAEIDILSRAGATNAEIWDRLGSEIQRAGDLAERDGIKLDPIIKDLAKWEKTQKRIRAMGDALGDSLASVTSGTLSLAIDSLLEKGGKIKKNERELNRLAEEFNVEKRRVNETVSEYYERIKQASKGNEEFDDAFRNLDGGARFFERLGNLAKDTSKDMLKSMINGFVSPFTDALQGLGRKAGEFLGKLVFGGGSEGGESKGLLGGLGVGDFLQKMIGLQTGGVVGMVASKIAGPTLTADTFVGPLQGMAMPMPGGNPAAAGIPGIGGGLAGGVGGVVSAAANAVGGIISAIGSMRQEGTLNAIEFNTRASRLHLEHTMDQILRPALLGTLHNLTWDILHPMSHRLGQIGDDIAKIAEGGKITFSPQISMAAAMPASIPLNFSFEPFSLAVDRFGAHVERFATSAPATGGAPISVQLDMQVNPTISGVNDPERIRDVIVDAIETNIENFGDRFAVELRNKLQGLAR